MKRFFQRVKNHVMSFVAPVKSSDVDTSCNEIYLSPLHYQPAADEPSFFTERPGEINDRWMAWYFKRNTNHGYVAMQLTADALRLQLKTEQPRQYPPGYLPDVLVGDPLMISFNWVIWYKYEFNTTFEEAYDFATLFARGN